MMESMTGPYTFTAVEFPHDHTALLARLKDQVRETRFRAARAANTEVLRLYWTVGAELVARREDEAWGSETIDRLATDLAREFPDQTGWSRRNLFYMRRVAETWPLLEDFVQQAAAQLPWGHILVLIDRLNTREERDWYAAAAVTQGWSRSVLLHHIKTGLRAATGAAPSNFAASLPAGESELAQQIVKDPYIFEHLGHVERALERDVEQALMDRLQDTMLELGQGMAFVGRQVRLTVPDDTTDGRTEEFYIDLLFFNVEQVRYVVVEIKIGDFHPGYLGQLGTYVEIIDDQRRRSEIHAPIIGILLCTGKQGPTVRYALASTAAPVAVAEYQGLPTPDRVGLPSTRQLEAAVADELAGLRSVRDEEASSSAPPQEESHKRSPK